MGRERFLLVVVLCTGCATAPHSTHRVPREAEYIKRVEAAQPLVRAAAERHGVPQDLVLGVIQVESSFRPDACSHAGARGLMQLMPRTAASLARRLGWADYSVEDPAFNIEAGTVYLAYLMKQFEGDLRLALAGYNAGPARVQRWQKQGRPLPAVVERYVVAVLENRDRFAVRASRPRIDFLDLDRQGLAELLRKKEQLYGERPDEALPAGDAEMVTREQGPAGSTRREAGSARSRSAPAPERGAGQLGATLAIP